MKKIMTSVLVIALVILFSACGPVDEPEVDCSLEPEHPDCEIIIDCDETPDHPTCNLEYSFEDTFEILDIENESVEDFEDMFALMSTFLTDNADLFSFTHEYEFDQFYSTQVNSPFGLLKDELIEYEYPQDVLLDGLDDIQLSITNEVSHFEFNPTQDEYVEGTVSEALIYEDYIGKSSIFVNEDGFKYIYEIEVAENPGEIVSIYEMTVVVTEYDRLVYEIVRFNDMTEENFDYFYLLFDSRIGYTVRDLKYYNDSLNYYESTVDLENNTSETKQFDLGSYREYSYSHYNGNDELYTQKIRTVSQIGEQFDTSTVAFYDGLQETVRLSKSIELVETSYLPTVYNLSYNIAYLNDWDIIYGNYIVKNNAELAFVTDMPEDSVSVSFRAVEFLFEDDLPTESLFNTPLTGITFDTVSLSDLNTGLSPVYNNEPPVYYDDNVISILDVDYDIRTELLDIFTANLDTEIHDRVMEYMIVEEILFEGDSALIELIDCETDPDNRLCPSTE